jgi:hypothetical protein
VESLWWSEGGKNAQTTMQKIITWIKKCGKQARIGYRACKDASFCLWNLKTFVLGLYHQFMLFTRNIFLAK